MSSPALDPQNESASFVPDEEDSLEEAWAHFIRVAGAHDEGLKRRVEAVETVAHQASSPSYLASLLPSLLRLAPPHELVKALRPLVEESIAEGVRKHSRVLADIIFPLIFPAIKRAVLDLMRQMLQAFDRTLEEALSIQGLKWRWEAYRSGQSFAEVVLLHSLIYRVEEVFFIHRQTGVLLAHAARENRKNPDAIAAMLTAIRDFVSDVYAEGQDPLSLKNLEVGDVQIWIEDIPYAALAVAVRGEAPQEYRDSLLTTCLTLRRDFERELLRFEGDVTPFSRAQETLQEIIIECLRDPPPVKPFEAAWKHFLLWLGRLALGVACVSLIGFVCFSVWRARQQEAELREFLGELTARQGVMVVEQASRMGGGYEVKALRDRFADTQSIAPPESVALVWGQYESLDPLIVLRRAQHILDPPPSVTLSLEAGTLRLEGAAPQAWMSKFKSLAPSLSGVGAIDEQELRNTDEEGFARAERRLQAMRLEPDGRLPRTVAPEEWTRDFVEEALLLDRHARALDEPFYIVLETSVGRSAAALARDRLQTLASKLSWALQTRGITTYRIIRTETKISEFGTGSVNIKVARHGVRYAKD